jgi:UDP-N-acetylglucosamine acyltransferase
MASVHATAIVGDGAELAGDVSVGAYAVVEGEVVIGSGSVIHPHAIVRGPTTLGPGNVVHPFAVLGGEPQDRRNAAGGRLDVGEGNIFREHVTVHRGTAARPTQIGAFNLFMVGAHIAHDASIGSHCVLANAVQVAGHCVIEDWVTFGGLSGIAQHVRVGESAFVAAAAACERSVPPFVVVQGDRARVRGLNVVGLRRRAVPEASIAALRRAVRMVWMSTMTRAQALTALDSAGDPFVGRLAAALRESALPERRRAPPSRA